MAISYLSPINLNQNEIQNVRLQNLGVDPSTPVLGQLWENTASHRHKIYDGTVNQIIVYQSDPLNSLAPPIAAVSMNNQLLTNLASPVNPLDAATKQYVDQSELGLDVKASVVAASTVAGTLATSFANGSVIDGITLATGNRILIKDQATGAENGIYVVNATGAPTRSADCNSTANYLTGAFTFVETGAANQGNSYVVATQGTITPDTTAVVWTQFSGTAVTANNLTGGVLGSVPYQSAASSTVMLAGNTANTDEVLVSHGTGSTSAAPAFSNAPALSAANMTSFPTLNQNTTGNATTATTAASLAGGPLGAIDYQSGTNTTTQLAPNTAATDQVVVSHGNGTTGLAPTLSNAPALSAANMTAFPTLNQNTTGNAATATLAANVTGPVAVANGGTGATTPAGARTNLGCTTKYAAAVGDGVSTSIVVTHSLGTQDVQVALYLATSPFNVVLPDVQITSTTTITLTFSIAPTSGQYRVVVIG